MSAARSPTSSVSLPTGEVLLDKTPTTPEDQSIGVMNGIGQLAQRLGLPLADFCASARDPRARHDDCRQHDDRDERRARPDCSSPRGTGTRSRCGACTRSRSGTPRTPLPRRSPAAGRASRSPSASTTDGEVLQPLDEDAVRRGVQRLQALGVQSIAVMFLFCFVNPAHERRAARDRSARSSRMSSTSRCRTRSCARVRSSSGCRPRW